jgi:uncharacterized protein YuzE
MSVTIAGIEFDNVEYDAGGDVLYLHVGDPSTAVDFDETPEGHHVRFGLDGNIVGLTIVRPKHVLASEGEIQLTLAVPERVGADDLRGVLA